VDQLNVEYASKLDGRFDLVNISIKLQSSYLKHMQRLIDPQVTVKWKYFAIYWIGLSLRKYNKSLADNSIPHTFDVPPFYAKCLSIFRNFAKNYPSISFQNLSSKLLYHTLLKPVLKRPRVISHFPLLDFRPIWQNVHHSFIDPYSRDISWKLIQGCLPVNFLLNRFGMSPTNRCQGVETLEHLFVNCPLTKTFYKFILPWLREIIPCLKLSTSTLRFSILPTNISPFQLSTMLCLLSEIRIIVWLARNKRKHDNCNITSNYLILSFFNRLSFRLFVDFDRFSCNEFMKYWNYPSLCNAIDTKLHINFSV